MATELAYIGAGSNLGDRISAIEKAALNIDLLPTTRLLRRAPVINTTAEGGPAPDYLNTVFEIETELTPEKLLDSLLDIEASLGRKRPWKNAPRTIDLDLLLYDSLTVETPNLRIPHPLMTRRFFVLHPLSNLRPSLIIPHTNLTVSEHLQRLTDKDYTVAEKQEN